MMASSPEANKDEYLEGLPSRSEGSANSQVDMNEDQLKIHY
jgi:hypothetical protein